MLQLHADVAAGRGGDFEGLEVLKAELLAELIRDGDVDADLAASDELEGNAAGTSEDIQHRLLCMPGAFSCWSSWWAMWRGQRALFSVHSFH